MSDIKISKRFGANIWNNIIEIGKFRSERDSEEIPEKDIEKHIEKFIEHEEIHNLIFKLENEVSSFLFDIIEYQTYSIWLQSLPFAYLFENRDREDCKMRKAERFNEIRVWLHSKALEYLESHKEKLLSQKEDQNRLRMERKASPSLPKTFKG